MCPVSCCTSVNGRNTNEASGVSKLCRGRWPPCAVVRRRVYATATWMMRCNKRGRSHAPPLHTLSGLRSNPFFASYLPVCASCPLSLSDFLSFAACSSRLLQSCIQRRRRSLLLSNQTMFGTSVALTVLCAALSSAASIPAPAQYEHFTRGEHGPCSLHPRADADASEQQP